MKVLFLEDVDGVAQGGEVKNVKVGFARNYLIPQQLAILATRDALQRVERLKKEADVARLKRVNDMKTLAGRLEGIQVNVEMRTGSNGRLYGSVTNAIVAEKLSEITERKIDRRTIEMPDSIRQVGNYKLRIRLYQQVEATITLLVHPSGTDPVKFLDTLTEAGNGESEVESDEEKQVSPDPGNDKEESVGSTETSESA